MDIITQEIEIPNHDVSLSIRREDLLHPHISGNKFRKLKYNLLEAQRLGCETIVTFGGAFSNHIAATAAAGKEYKIKTIGIIRGEELCDIGRNQTLSFAENCGMELHFISRKSYSLKASEEFISDLKQKFGNIYLIPEGGTNALAVRGCEEILTPDDRKFDYICCAVGTGGTISGIANSAKPHQKILGFPALKGEFIFKDVELFSHAKNWTLINDYHFGGYAKVDAVLINFMNEFYKKNLTLLDPIYTGKLLYGVMDMIRKGYFPPKSQILTIHTGGLQGIGGMNSQLKIKNLPLIETK